MAVYKPVTIVDRDDNVIGYLPLFDAIDQGAIRRTAKVFIRRSSGEIFLQKRSDTVAFFPGVLDQSAGGHVDEGDSYEETAQKELKEELGIEASLHEIAHVFAEECREDGTLMYMWSKLYVGTFDGELLPDPEEVAGGEWLTPSEIDELVESQPDVFVPSFIPLWDASRHTFK